MTRANFAAREKTMTKATIVVTAALAAALSGCAATQSVERIQTTSFEKYPDGLSFRYVGFADAAYPEDSPAGEAYRMQLLSDWLSENSMCPRGYRLGSRDVTIVKKGLIGTIAKVAYTGRCS